MYELRQISLGTFSERRNHLQRVPCRPVYAYACVKYLEAVRLFHADDAVYQKGTEQTFTGEGGPTRTRLRTSFHRDFLSDEKPPLVALAYFG